MIMWSVTQGFDHKKFWNSSWQLVMIMFTRNRTIHFQRLVCYDQQWPYPGDQRFLLCPFIKQLLAGGWSTSDVSCERKPLASLAMIYVWMDLELFDPITEKSITVMVSLCDHCTGVRWKKTNNFQKICSFYSQHGSKKFLQFKVSR